MIRYVENRSKAKHVYTTGADSQVTCGIGHWAVTTEYAHAGTFNQEIRVAGIEDGVAVLWDADAIPADQEDADHCFVPERHDAGEVQEALAGCARPKGLTPRFTACSIVMDQQLGHGRLYPGRGYWKKKPIKRTLALLPDGTIEDLTDQVKDFRKGQVAGRASMAGTTKAARASKSARATRICRYLITMAEILEESDWPGMNIPVSP
jgi:hypothetical protein